MRNARAARMRLCCAALCARSDGVNAYRASFSTRVHGAAHRRMALNACTNGVGDDRMSPHAHVSGVSDGRVAPTAGADLGWRIGWVAAGNRCPGARSPSARVLQCAQHWILPQL